MTVRVRWLPVRRSSSPSVPRLISRRLPLGPLREFSPRPSESSQSVERMTTTAPSGSGNWGPGCISNYVGGQNCEYEAYPRVTCGGYDGWVGWDDDYEGTIDVWTYGEVWDTCYADTTYVYLSWEQDMGLRHGNDQAGWASNNTGTQGVNYDDAHPDGSLGGVSNVSVTVCNTYNYGWHCGAQYHV
jgi:hypothetical protein